MTQSLREKQEMGPLHVWRHTLIVVASLRRFEQRGQVKQSTSTPFLAFTYSFSIEGSPISILRRKRTLYVYVSCKKYILETKGLIQHDK